MFYSGVAVCVKVVQSACPSHVPSYWTPKAKYENKKYYRNCQGLSTIPDNIPAEAEGVAIAGNNISTVPVDAFSQLSHCTTINLRRNEIERIEPGAFNGLISLEVLGLHDNKLSVIEPGTFNGLISLEGLGLENNKLSVIEPGTFNGLISLEELWLSYNKLSEIEPGAFSQLPALDWLLLDGNKLIALQWTVFTDGTGNITRPASLVLELDWNPLQCDTSLCWVKQAEQDGWLTLDSDSDPDCANYPDTDWPDVNLQCNTMGKSL